MATTDPSRIVLRQLAATLAYRAAKVLRDVPAGFGHRAFGDSTRQPVRIVAHMADLMAWGVSMAAGGKEWKAEGGDDWATEVNRFFSGLAALDAAIAADGAVRRLNRQADSGSACRRLDARRAAIHVAGHGRRAGSPGELRARDDRGREGRPRTGAAWIRIRRRRQREAIAPLLAAAQAVVDLLLRLRRFLLRRL